VASGSSTSLAVRAGHPRTGATRGPGHRGRLSSALITSARTADRAAPLGIAYVVGDATHTNRLEPAPFDDVDCNIGMSDIDDLDALDTVAALLLPGGLLVFSILHPCSPDGVRTSPVPGHRVEATSTRDGVHDRQRLHDPAPGGSNHRMLSTYLNALAKRGLPASRVLESPPPRGWLDARPSADPVPSFLVVRCSKQEEPDDR
jgi:SAM-dependent methyltransferase